MAISTQANQIALRKAANFMRANANGANDMIFKGFKMGLNQSNVTDDLQFVSFANLTGDTVIADAASQIYAIFLKKQATATDAYFKVVNHATVAAGSTFHICIALLESGDQCLLLFPNGLPMATGITLCSSTTDTGTTDSTSGDGPDGFFLIGA